MKANLHYNLWVRNCGLLHIAIIRLNPDDAYHFAICAKQNWEKYEQAYLAEQRQASVAHFERRAA